jgi:hypothetical protein
MASSINGNGTYLIQYRRKYDEDTKGENQDERHFFLPWQMHSYEHRQPYRQHRAVRAEVEDCVGY